MNQEPAPSQESDSSAKKPVGLRASEYPPINYKTSSIEEMTTQDGKHIAVEHIGKPPVHKDDDLPEDPFK